MNTWKYKIGYKNWNIDIIILILDIKFTKT